jgi:hypothetical protein
MSLRRPPEDRAQPAPARQPLEPVGCGVWHGFPAQPCERQATTVLPHRTLGGVPACDECATRVERIEAQP